MVAEWITEEQRVRIAELVAEGATSWRLQQETGLSRFAVHRAVRRLAKRPVVAPRRNRQQTEPAVRALGTRTECSWSQGIIASHVLIGFDPVGRFMWWCSGSRTRSGLG